MGGFREKASYRTVYDIEDCRSVTSQTHTFTSVPNNRFSSLRANDPQGYSGFRSIVVDVQPNIPAPVLETLSPELGPSTGGNTLVMTGQNLTGTTEVRFSDRVITTPFTVDSDTQITLTVPSGSTRADITVYVPNGGESNALRYTYVRPPAINHDRLNYP